MRHHQPPHQERSEGAFWAWARDEGWPWVKESAGRLKDFLMGGGGGGGGGGGDGSGGGGGGGGGDGSGGEGSSRAGGA